MKRNIGHWVAAATVAATTPGAQAQQLEEITVTAQRRETQLQTTPVAISAFTAEQMERRQIVETGDLMRVVPNFNINNNTGLGTANAYWLRGSGVGESIATFDPPVGTYIDEVFHPRINAAQQQMLDIERIEVLRGPQGTLFGRNTTAGAISIVTRTPQPEFEGHVQLGIGNYDRKEAKTTINVPLSDRLYGRVSGYWVESDGNMRSLTSGDRYNGSDSWGARAALRFVPNEQVDWTVSATYSDASELAIGTALAVGRNPVDDGIGTAIVSGDLFRNYVALRPCRASGDIYAEALAGCTFNVSKQTFITSNLQWMIGDATLSFITGFQDNNVKFSADFLDNHPQQPLGPFVGPHFYIIGDLDLQSISQEVKLVGDFGDRLSYVAGLFYMEEDNRSLIGDLGGPGAIVFTRRDLGNDTRSQAAYVQGDWRATDRLTFTAGLRFTDETKDLDVTYTNVLSGVTFTNETLLGLGYPVKQTESKWTPKVGVQFQFTPDVMAFISATNGFKSGGWNARVNQAALLVPFGPEEVWSYEAGIRSEWLDRRLRVNASVFRADYEDRQIATSFPGTTAFVTTNAGDTLIQGLELEVSALPLDGLNVYLTVGLMDGELRNLTQSAIATGLGPNTIPIQTPEWSVLGGFSYEWQVPALAGALTLTADASSKDLYYSDWANLPNQQVDQPTLVSASLGYRTDDARWSVALECKNCTDREWVRQNLIQVAYPGDPLNWGLRLNYRFQ